MEAAWENWIEDENRRCRQVGLMLEAERNQTDPEREEARSTGLRKKARTALKQNPGKGGAGDAREKEVLGEEVYLWYLDYCSSCRQGRDALLGDGACE